MIKIIKSLSIQFLWIDSLRILQDRKLVRTEDFADGHGVQNLSIFASSSSIDDASVCCPSLETWPYKPEQGEPILRNPIVYSFTNQKGLILEMDSLRKVTVCGVGQPVEADSGIV